MGRRRQPWKVGDLFALPLNDGRAILGQVIGQENDALNSVSVALFDRILEPDPVAVMARLDEVFAVLFATRDQLDAGAWKVFASSLVEIPPELFPWEHTRHSRWVGAEIHGSGNIASMVNAYFGLTPWNERSAYFDGLLVSPAKRRPG